MAKEHVEQIKELLSNGLTRMEIADSLGLTYDSVCQTIRRYPKEFILLHTESEEIKAPSIDISDAVAIRNKIELRDEINLLRKQRDELLRNESLAHKIVAEITPLVQSFPELPDITHLEKNKKKSEQSALCLLSCLHFGEIVDKESTMGLGEYNPRIAAARVQYYVDTVLDLIFNKHKGENVQDLWVVNVGDNISGDIHDELKKTNAFPFSEQIVRAASLWSMALRDLSAHFKTVNFIGVVGNHGRLSKKPEFKETHNNADWIIYNIIQSQLSEYKNIHFDIPKSPWWTGKIEGKNFFFAHGDNIRSVFSFPWYDAQKFTAAVGQMLIKDGKPFPEFFGFGQFHQANSAQLSYGEWLFTGSIKGPDEYSLGKLRAGADAVQMFVGVHKDIGMTFRYPIFLNRADAIDCDRYACVADSDWIMK